MMLCAAIFAAASSSVSTTVRRELVMPIQVHGKMGPLGMDFMDGMDVMDGG